MTRSATIFSPCIHTQAGEITHESSACTPTSLPAPAASAVHNPKRCHKSTTTHQVLASGYALLCMGYNAPQLL